MKYLILFVIICYAYGQDIATTVPVTEILTTKPITPTKIIPVTKPTQPGWPGSFSTADRTILANWLLSGCWITADKSKCNNVRPTEVEFAGFDGWYNNLARPDSGAIDGPLLRRWPAAYKDGTYLPSGSTRPNPLTLSEQLLNGTVGSQSRTGKNALLVFFGQQVVEEILDAQRPACPPEYFNIEIPKNHTFFKDKPHHTELPLLRTRYDQKTGYSPNNPRQQINEITPYIDGGLMYGITKQWSDQLRTYSNGTLDPNGLLAFSHGGLFPEYNTHRLPMANPPPPFHHKTFIQDHEIHKVSRFFKLGNPRGNENTFLLTFGVLWFRWHNYLARQIRHQEPKWSSDKVFNEARKWVIGTYQHIVLDEWLPAWVNVTTLPPYKGYDPSINPQIDQFFQAAAFRFGHTLVPPGVYLRDYGRNGCNHTFTKWGHNAIRTCNSFWRPQDAIKTNYSKDEFMDIDRVLMGMSVQLCEEEDHKIVEDLRGNVFGPLEFPRRDLMAVNIQRARDHGLPDFNSARKAFGLLPLKDENDLRRHYKDIVKTDVLNRLMNLYKDVNNIDPWIGGILETGDGPGELFRTIIVDQFRRIRDGDRFWFNNTENGLFTIHEIDRIKELKLYDVIMAVTKMDANDIPKNPFNVPKDKTEVAATCNLKLIKCTILNATNQKEKENCFVLPILNSEALNETCVKGDTYYDYCYYDYFLNSDLSYILTHIFLGTFLLGAIGVIFVLLKLKDKEGEQAQMKISHQVRNSFRHDKRIEDPVFTVMEWCGEKLPMRPVAIVLNSDLKQIRLMTHKGVILRVVDLSMESCKLTIYLISDEPYVLIKALQDYDLMLKFDSIYLRENFHTSLERFIENLNIERQMINNFTLKAVTKICITKENRQKQLEMFFRVVFAQGWTLISALEAYDAILNCIQFCTEFNAYCAKSLLLRRIGYNLAFQIQHSRDEILKVDAKMAKTVINTELTLSEFADALSMRPEAEFVLRMFQLIDKDKNGFVSFREFVDLLIIFAEGDETQKAKLLFDMYDINGVQSLTLQEFVNMIKSFLETVEGKIEPEELQKTVKNMLESAGLHHKKSLTFEDFKRIIGDNIVKLNHANLGFKGMEGQQNLFLDSARDTIESIYDNPVDIKARLQGTAATRSFTHPSKQVTEDNITVTTLQTKPTTRVKILKYCEENSKELFWLSLYTLVLWAVFAERAYYYSVEREHSGLRRIAGYGVTVTRGAASAMMFTYSSLLVTMCRNTITFLRDTAIGPYFPFDSFVEIHKYIAYWALVFTIMHIIGHSFNFYHISTQTADDLTCLFRNYFHATHVLPKFHYWAWQTMTGITGIILTLLLILIYLFAQTFVRKRLYNWFWYTHSLYPVFFIFMILHGSGRLIQEPFFYYFFLGPVILFTLDMVTSVSRKKVEIPVIKAEILPSNVTMLEFKRPENFEYKSGQWVRIACLGLNANEFHPFTLTSGPDEANLTLHIRSVGPWTRNIRLLYDNSKISDKALPKIHLDGPYGEGHQDWYRYDVAVLIGGGIGVTPFASILKDIVFRANIKHKAQCKKVYFIWVSRTQKQFEWLVDILRDLEKLDENKIVSSHIFITQFYQKFDLRTILLYICERHYQKISDKSLFTNLQAVTHFGRPKFKSFFKSLLTLHHDVRTVGVFSCGPPQMTSSIESACVDINRITVNGPTFKHHFKNF